MKIGSGKKLQRTPNIARFYLHCGCSFLKFVLFNRLMVPVYSSLVLNKDLGNYRSTRTTRLHFSFMCCFIFFPPLQIYLELNTLVVFTSLFPWFLDIKIFCQHFLVSVSNSMVYFLTKVMILESSECSKNVPGVLQIIIAG